MRHTITVHLLHDPLVPKGGSAKATDTMLAPYRGLFIKKNLPRKAQLISCCIRRTLVVLTLEIPEGVAFDAEAYNQQVFELLMEKRNELYEIVQKEYAASPRQMVTA